MASEFADAWLSGLTNSTAQAEHLPAMADAAVLGGPMYGKEFAKGALTLWMLQNASAHQTSLTATGVACRVAEAQVVCDRIDGFKNLVSQINTSVRSQPSSYLSYAARELTDLSRLLDGEPGTRPGVESWLQPGPTSKDEATLQWQFVLPELSSNPSRPIYIPVGDRDSTVASQKPRDARWWKAGTPLPALAKLANKFDIDVFIGASPTDLELVGEQRSASYQGSMALKGLPPSGFLRVDVHFSQRSVLTGELRPYSLNPAVVSSGGEPNAKEAGEATGATLQPTPFPASWQPVDELRWGRLTGPPIPIQQGTEYLLSEWSATHSKSKPIRVRLILLDENQKPLGPVPVISTGPVIGHVSPLDPPLQ